MAYPKDAKEQLYIIRQSCLNRAVDLFIADKIKPGRLEAVAEYFVGCIYSKLGLPVGAAFSESQTQGAIVLQSSLNRATDLVVAGIIETKEIISSMSLFATYVYEGLK